MTITSRIILKNKNTENEQRQEAREIALTYNNQQYTINSYNTELEKHEYNGRTFTTTRTNIFNCEYKTHFILNKRKSEKQTQYITKIFEDICKKFEEDYKREKEECTQ